MTTKIQSSFEECRKKYITFVSTGLGYNIGKDERNEDLVDYECLATIIGLKPEKIKNVYENTNKCGAILIRKNGAS